MGFLKFLGNCLHFVMLTLTGPKGRGIREGGGGMCCSSGYLDLSYGREVGVI